MKFALSGIFFTTAIWLGSVKIKLPCSEIFFCRAGTYFNLVSLTYLFGYWGTCFFPSLTRFLLSLGILLYLVLESFYSYFFSSTAGFFYCPIYLLGPLILSSIFDMNWSFFDLINYGLVLFFNGVVFVGFKVLGSGGFGVFTFYSYSLYSSYISLITLSIQMSTFFLNFC